MHHHLGGAAGRSQRGGWQRDPCYNSPDLSTPDPRAGTVAGLTNHCRRNHVKTIVADDLDTLRRTAREARRLIVQTVYHAKAGHLGGPLSAADVLTVLYFSILRVDPERPDWPDRDRFILSKGHSAIGLYTILAL